MPGVLNKPEHRYRIVFKGHLAQEANLYLEAKSQSPASAVILGKQLG